MKYLFSIAFIFFCTVVFSQELDSLFFDKKAPKIGLVLSGGGAKGLAHIGVLKVLEEEGVKIDYIGGTSMGAMIGGLYASGYTAEQLDSIFRVTNFDSVVQDFLPRKVKSSYERENDEKYALTLPFQKFKFGIPLALSRGQNTYNLFSKLMYDVRHIDDFNKLPIPFLCMATDAETGEAVLLNKGSLPKAVVASGTFPSLFSPVIIDGRYLIDGGVVNNYPIKEVRELGADIIIGVDVQTDLMDREQMSSAAKVVMQIVNFQMLSSMGQKQKDTDIYIKPDITGFNVVSFNDGQQIVQNGVNAAEPYRELFRKIADLQQSPKKETVLKEHTKLNHISSIEIKGSENYSRSYVMGKLRFRENQEISFAELTEGFNRLNATQNFRNIGYHFETTEEGKEKLVIELAETNIKTFVRFGLHYDELYKSGLLINLTHKNLITKNDVISTDLILGDNVRYNLDYYIDNGFYWSFGFRSRFNQFNSNVPSTISGLLSEIQDINRINVNYYDFTQQAYFQTIFKHIFSVGGGIEYKLIDINSDTVNINGTSFNDMFRTSNFLSTYGYISLDTYDKKYFPTSGIYFDGNFKWILNSNVFGDQFGRYSIVQGNFGYAKSFFNRFTILLGSEAGFAVGESDGMLDFILGGYGYHTINSFKHFYGYDFLSKSGNSFLKSQIGIDVEIFRKNHLNFYANYANLGHNIFDKLDTWFTSPEYSGYAVGYGMETVIGPIEVKYSWSPETNSNFWWVNVGFWF